MSHHPGRFPGNLSHQRTHPSQKGLHLSREVVEPGMVLSDFLLRHHLNPQRYQPGLVLAILLLRLEVPLHL